MTWQPDAPSTAATAELLAALELIVATLESHDAVSLDCDRRGEKYCECLTRSVERARAAIAKAKGTSA